MKTRLEIVAALLCAALALSLAACGGADTADTVFSPLQISQEIAASQEGLGEIRTLTPGDEEYATYLNVYYAIEEGLLEDGAICYVGGTDASEIAVFSVKPEADTGAVRDILLQYIEGRIDDFFGYMPDQVFLLEQAAVVTRGSYVAMMICREPGQAEAAFADCFRSGAGAEALVEEPVLPVVQSVAAAVSEEDTEEADAYDAAAVLAAWQSGDDSQLTDKNRSILEACAAVIAEAAGGLSSEYDMELAIHDWLIKWAQYDAEVKNHAPDASPHPDNDNPYGLLIGRRAICTGYTTTFQLLMDMLEIECITVNGKARSGVNDHAWNMVRLDGEWYCVDLTWNDPLGLEEYDHQRQHKYFNVTSAYMEETDHQWDTQLYPEAIATKHAWKGE